MSDRVPYPDICKFIAIFLVTWSHCAQVISGEIWTNLWGGYQFDIAFNMPLFMIMSGWFINPDKIRKTKFFDYACAKFLRLIVPGIAWYLLLSLITFQRPTIISSITFYWYLTALFVGLCIIALGCKTIKNTHLCCLITIILVLATPHSSFSKINFMFPFLWVGYYLNKYVNTLNTNILWGGALGLLLYNFWSPEMTVYVTPFDTSDFSIYTLCIYLYRFLIGFCLSAPIIYLIKANENGLLHRFSALGQYSLVIYTGSALFVSIGSRLLNFINWHLNIIGLVDIVSFIAAFSITYILINTAKFFRRYKFTQLLFCGE